MRGKWLTTNSDQKHAHVITLHKSGCSIFRRQITPYIIRAALSRMLKAAAATEATSSSATQTDDVRQAVNAREAISETSAAEQLSIHL